MAEQIISPGVFTRENDLSFLPQGVGAIGAAIVGPTVQGPAFTPTVVKSFQEFETKFGPLSSETFIPQTVKEYIRQAGSVTVTRVLGGGGYTFSTGNVEPIAILAGSGVTSTAAPASGALNVTGEFGQLPGDEIQVTIGGTETRFIGSGGPTAPLDDASNNIFFFVTGSSTGTFLTNVAAEINAANIGVSVVSSSNGLEFTSSNAGVAGNLITVETGSGGTINTDTLTLAGGLDTSIGGGVLIGMIYPSKALGTPTLAKSVIPASQIISSSFGITLSGSGITTTKLTASLNPTDSNYLFNQLGDSPDNSQDGAVSYSGTPSGYTYINFKQLQSSILATDNLSGYSSGIGSGSVVQLAKMSATDAVFNGSEVNATEGYSFASTPFIQSQIALGQKDLFRFHTISHGTELNRKYKISIANLKEPADIDGEEQYSTFSVLVRSYDSNDNGSPLEVFNGVNLDPTSPQYISIIIGDRYPQYNETLDKV